MKNYDDFAEEVFREADRRLALKRKRAAVIRQYTLAFASMFAIILTGIFVIKNETVREALEKKFNAQNIITDESSVTAPPTNTTVPDHGSYEPEITTEAFTSPPDGIRNTTAKPAASTTAAKTTTTAKTTASHSPVSTTDANTSYISVTSTRTTARNYVSSTKTSTVTVSKTTHTTATATRSTKTTATTSRIYVTSTTGTRTTVTTQNPLTTTSGGTFTTTIHDGTYLTSTTFSPSASTSWATKTTTTITTTSTKTTSLVTYTVSSTTTSVPQTTAVTQPLYPDIQLPAETADPSGNTTVPVNYRCIGELSADLQLGSKAGETTIYSGGVQYVCDVYSLAGSSLLDYAVIYIREKQEWLIYMSFIT